MHTITDRLSERLSQAHYRLRAGEQLNASPVQFVASKIKWVPLAILSTHIVVLEKDNANIQDIKELFGKGFNLAKRINRIPLLRGMQFGYAILPLIIGKNPDSELLLYVASSPTLRFSLFSLPIVVDLSACRVAFFQGYKSGGSMVWPMLQEIVIKHIEPLVDEEHA